MCYELMREMRWSWAELEATPAYVRHFVWDFIMRERRIKNRRGQVAPDTPGVVRVKR